jgi:Meiotically up-regulated gene 113
VKIKLNLVCGGCGGVADPDAPRCRECGYGTSAVVRDRGVVEIAGVMCAPPSYAFREIREIGPGRVYFVGANENDAPIKIGFTTGSADDRRRQLQTGHPLPLVLWAVLDADFRYERKIHDRFRASRLQGEWFKRTPDLLEFMATCARPAFFESCYPVVVV